MVLKKTNKSSKKKKEKIPQKTKEEIATDIISKIPNGEKEDDKKNTKKWPGRPDKITYTTLQKLKVCFAVGMTDEFACYYCGISKSTLYNYQNENPEFMEEKDILKQSITLHSKFNIWKAIKEWSVSDSWKRLEKKDPEFRDKIQIDWNITTQMSQEDKEIYNKILQKNLKIWNKQTKN